MVSILAGLGYGLLSFSIGTFGYKIVENWEYQQELKKINEKFKAKEIKIT